MTGNIRRKHGPARSSAPSQEIEEPSSTNSAESTNGQTPIDETMDTDINMIESEQVDRIPARRASSFPPRERPPEFDSSFETPQTALYDSNDAETNLFRVVSPQSVQWESSQLNAIVSPRVGYDAAQDQWRNTPKEFASPIAIHHSSHTSPVTAATNRSNQSTALSGVPETMTDHSYLGLQEACLLRHFIEELAPWVWLTTTCTTELAQDSDYLSVRHLRSRPTFCSGCPTTSHVLPDTTICRLHGIRETSHQATVKEKC